jgi:hypothetical protein
MNSSATDRSGAAGTPITRVSSDGGSTLG